MKRCIRRLASGRQIQQLPNGRDFEVWGNGLHPVLALNGGGGLDRLRPIAEHLKWQSGLLSVALPADQQHRSETSDILKQLLTERHVPFAHCLAHSWGALGAAGFGLDFIDLLGCVVLLDAPIVNKPMWDNHVKSLKLKQLLRDPNVPSAEIQSLEASLSEPPVLALDNEDEATSHALALEVLANLQQFQHPMIIVRCESGGRMDEETLQVHSELFNLKRVVTIPNTTCHDDLFGAQAAPLVADAVDGFLREYDTQSIVEARLADLRKRYLHAKSTETNKTEGRADVTRNTANLTALRKVTSRVKKPTRNRS